MLCIGKVVVASACLFGDIFVVAGYGCCCSACMTRRLPQMGFGR